MFGFLSYLQECGKVKKSLDDFKNMSKRKIKEWRPENFVNKIDMNNPCKTFVLVPRSYKY